ncbi:MAG: hypothetical protein LBM08_05500 [Dysgonamonadaceae bacterium]|nr:hypothetical protein [Dysgonamonadaceae bacterium]
MNRNGRIYEKCFRKQHTIFLLPSVRYRSVKLQHNFLHFHCFETFKHEDHLTPHRTLLADVFQNDTVAVKLFLADQLPLSLVSHHDQFLDADRLQQVIGRVWLSALSEY